MSKLISDGHGHDIFITTTLAPDRPSVEAYHLASVLGYSQQSSIRKQVLTDWGDLFKEGHDYELVRDSQQLVLYELTYKAAVGAIRPMKPERGRMFLTVAGLKKVFERTSKECQSTADTLLRHMGEPRRRRPPLPSPVTELHPTAPDERWRSYQILETLLEHLKHSEDLGIKTLAIMSAELGLGRSLDDIRNLFLKEPARAAPGLVSDQAQPAPKPPTAPAPPARVRLEELPWPVPGHPASQPSMGTFFPLSPRGVHWGLKQIGERAGGYSAVQAGKAADIVASKLGYTHDDIRTKKLPFNDLPELPDTTSGKLRQMYRFNTLFSNHVIVELRFNTRFVPGKPVDLGPFSSGGKDFPKLSKGPFEE